MKTLGFVFLSAVAAFAATPASTHIQGEYVEARTADVWTGPCFANSEVGLMGNFAVMGWRVEKGTFEGVPLDGLSVVGVLAAKHTLGDWFEPAFPVKSVLIIDERATPAQAAALRRFAQRMAGDLLTDVAAEYRRPVSFTYQGSIHARRVRLTAGNLAELETRALEEGDAICHSNEGVWYPPLAKLDHAMAAFAISHNYRGGALQSTWSSPNKRSAFVGTFHYNG